MRNKIILLMLLSMITAFSYQESYEVLAHFEEIDVIYDQCQYDDYVDENNIGDGIDERWYNILPDDNSKPAYHFYDTSFFETQTIKYFVSEFEYISEENTNISNLWDWTSELPNSYTNTQKEQIAIEVKQNFVNSIKKWNNIYIYSIDENNNISKKD